MCQWRRRRESADEPNPLYLIRWHELEPRIRILTPPLRRPGVVPSTSPRRSRALLERLPGQTSATAAPVRGYSTPPITKTSSRNASSGGSPARTKAISTGDTSVGSTSDAYPDSVTFKSICPPGRAGRRNCPKESVTPSTPAPTAETVAPSKTEPLESSIAVPASDPLIYGVSEETGPRRSVASNSFAP